MGIAYYLAEIHPPDDLLYPGVWQTEGPPVSSERRNKRNRTTAAPDEKDTQWSAEGVADGQALLVRPPERERECVCVCRTHASGRGERNV